MVRVRGERHAATFFLLWAACDDAQTLITSRVKSGDNSRPFDRAVTAGIASVTHWPISDSSGNTNFLKSRATRSSRRLTGHNKCPDSSVGWMTMISMTAQMFAIRD
jgi:hypothetical protein